MDDDKVSEKPRVTPYTMNLLRNSMRNGELKLNRISRLNGRPVQGRKKVTRGNVNEEVEVEAERLEDIQMETRLEDTESVAAPSYDTMFSVDPVTLSLYGCLPSLYPPLPESLGSFSIEPSRLPWMQGGKDNPHPPSGERSWKQSRSRPHRIRSTRHVGTSSPSSSSTSKPRRITHGDRLVSSSASSREQRRSPSSNPHNKVMKSRHPVEDIILACYQDLHR